VRATLGVRWHDTPPLRRNTASINQIQKFGSQDSEFRSQNSSPLLPFSIFLPSSPKAASHASPSRAESCFRTPKISLFLLPLFSFSLPLRASAPLWFLFSIQPSAFIPPICNLQSAILPPPLSLLPSPFSADLRYFFVPLRAPQVGVKVFLVCQNVAFGAVSLVLFLL